MNRQSMNCSASLEKGDLVGDCNKCLVTANCVIPEAVSIQRIQGMKRFSRIIVKESIANTSIGAEAIVAKAAVTNA